MVFSLIYFCIFFTVFLILLYLWLFKFNGHREQRQAREALPSISILVAARNEERHILTCLASIDQLDYPKDKVEVLVGDDRSQDATRLLVQEFIKDKPFIKLVVIEHDVPGLKGKANVLAQLARLATSDYFFFTDADIEVPTGWVRGLLQELTGNMGIVTGITTTKGNTWFARMQSLDWLYSLGLMQVVADRGLPVSTMGNNMVVTRSAYESVGGYEGIPFSITEDVQLFKHVLQKGYSTTHVFDKAVLALSEPVSSLPVLLHQRKRWMRGAWQLPWYISVLLVLTAMYFPVWLPFFIYTSVGTMLLIGLVKVLVQSVFVVVAAKRAGRTIRWFDFLGFEVYQISISILLIFYYFLPFKINWKGRLY